MRKREQELLSKIRDQQKELDAVKQEKFKVEKELSRQERERQEERRQIIEKERNLEMERQRFELNEKERRNNEDRERALQMTREREMTSSQTNLNRRVLNREKASPAHLRGRRPPSLVSSEDDEEVAMLSSRQSAAVTAAKPPRHEPLPAPPATTPPTQPKDNSYEALKRRNSLRRKISHTDEIPTASNTLRRSNSLRVKQQSNEGAKPPQTKEADVAIKIHRAPVQAGSTTPNVKRKNPQSSSYSNSSKDVGLVNIHFAQLLIFLNNKLTS